jgi:fused signal recognition particle receptor
MREVQVSVAKAEPQGPPMPGPVALRHPALLALGQLALLPVRLDPLPVRQVMPAEPPEQAAPLVSAVPVEQVEQPEQAEPLALRELAEPVEPVEPVALQVQVEQPEPVAQPEPRVQAEPRVQPG